PYAGCVASTRGQTNWLCAEEARARVAMHPRREVLHACDVQPACDLRKDFGIVVGAFTDEMRVPAVAEQLRSEHVRKPFRDYLLADGDRHRVPYDSARRVPHIVVQFMNGNRFESLQNLGRGPDGDGDVAADSTECGQPLDLVDEVLVVGIA